MYPTFTITIPEPYREALGTRLIGLGCLGTEEHGDAIIAYFPESIDQDLIVNELELLRVLFKNLVDPVAMTIVRSFLPQADWNESWKKSFQPVDAGMRFTILPPWVRHSGKRIPLIIDPGMAFGTGHHETTRSCLVLMERYAGSVKTERLLDLGTGTGLLAIAARALGFRSVVGVDTDSLAIEASQRNIELNKTEGIELFEGGIDQCEGSFDMIAANLISGTLVQLAGKIASHLIPEGIVIMSGILKGQDDDVVTAAKISGLTCIERLVDGKWVSLACRR